MISFLVLQWLKSWVSEFSVPKVKRLRKKCFRGAFPPFLELQNNLKQKQQVIVEFKLTSKDFIAD